MSQDLKSIIDDYKSDDETVYNSWFVNNDERLKAFRTIRRGVFDVIEDIKNGGFGNDFKGSSLEFVLHNNHRHIWTPHHCQGIEVP